MVVEYLDLTGLMLELVYGALRILIPLDAVTDKVNIFDFFLAWTIFNSETRNKEEKDHTHLTFWIFLFCKIIQICPV